MAGCITALDQPANQKITSVDAGVRGEVIAVGYETGVVTVLAESGDDASVHHEVFAASLGQGPVFVGVDEAEAVLWAAVVDGRVYRLNLAAVGREVNGAECDFVLVGEHDAEIMHACLNKDRGYFVTADSKGDIALWNTKTGDHIKQPRRVLTAPGRGRWHLVASAGDHVVAVRRNPEVYVFDLAGGAHEVRTLCSAVSVEGSGEAVNVRQVRSLLCTEYGFCVGFSDGSLQRVAFADRDRKNAFDPSVAAKKLSVRAVVHKAKPGARSKAPETRCPVRSIALHRPQWHGERAPTKGEDGALHRYLSAACSGLALTDLTRPAEPASKTVLGGVDVLHVVSTSSHAFLFTPVQLIKVPWPLLAPSPVSAP
ncbi:hypothetical protein DIPPA_14534 [Diplonema papillatum]|nr:hypothetical protein DIPPA_14534 [Diplonema papillatum]|eukprot:gene8641-13365_t